MPLRLDDRISGDDPRMGDATNWWVQVTGRLRPGLTAEQVRGNLGPVFQRQARAGLDSYLAASTEAVRNRSENQQRTAVPHLLVDSASRGTYDTTNEQIEALSILATVVALVLLLVCANVANLLLARATARQREISVRLSIGATRARVIRQLLTESLLLAAMGGVAGILVARWGQALLPSPVGTTAPVDWRVLAFTAAMTTLAGIVFGIAPALRATRTDVGVALKENTRSIARSSTVLSRALLVTQVSISMLLLIGAGLFLRTLDNLRNVDIGFDPRNLVFVRVDAEGSGLSDERKFQYLQDAMTRLRACTRREGRHRVEPHVDDGWRLGNCDVRRGTRLWRRLREHARRDQSRHRGAELLRDNGHSTGVGPRLHGFRPPEGSGSGRDQRSRSTEVLSE
jgi:hypothetical protein